MSKWVTPFFQWFLILLVCLLTLGACALEVSVWRECQQDHSFFYCMRVLSK